LGALCRRRRFELMSLVSCQYSLLSTMLALWRPTGSVGYGELETLLRAADELSGWPGECAAFCIHMFAWTGVRKNELCAAHREDLSVDTWTFKVRHPKGEGTYGRQRIVPIPDRLKPVVIRYLKARDEMLAGRGEMEVVPLVPSVRNPERSITRGAIDKWVWDVSEKSGVQFNPHALRRTYGQILIDNGVSVETVSVMLGHSFTTTTEKHYCRKTADSARLEVIRAWRVLRSIPAD
ncbi:MAG: site-specific integrase, partial [Methanobacteriota archaeon]